MRKDGYNPSIKGELLKKVCCGLFVDAFSRVVCESVRSDKVVMFPVNYFVFNSGLLSKTQFEQFYRIAKMTSVIVIL